MSLGFAGFPTWLHIMFPASFHGHRSRKSPILHSVSGFLFSSYKLPCGTMSDTDQINMYSNQTSISTFVFMHGSCVQHLEMLHL